MKITSSESKGKLERSGKGLITSQGFKTKLRPKKVQKARYAIGNVIKKYLYKIIRDFEKFEKLSYFHLARQLPKCMMRSDNFSNFSKSLIIL